MKKIIPFSWYGGKFSQLDWLLPLIDQVSHITYVEPFGGAAAILLNKKASLVEVYNDIYSDVVNFFRVLRSQHEELIPLLELTPYSREEFALACENNETDELERARMFFVKARQVRTGLATKASPGRWAYVVKHSRRGMSQVTSRWMSSIDGLEEICERLREVQIENLDAFDVIQRYDSPDTLHYLDPPYLMDTRSGGVGYSHEFDEAKHRQLVDVAKTLKGKVILSGYDNEIYAEGLIDWSQYRPGKKTSWASLSGENHTKEDRLREEVVWKNFERN